MPKNDKLLILVLVGTTRHNRESIKAAKYVAEIGSTIDGVEIQLVDPKEFNFPGDGNFPEGKDPRYGDLTARADAFFIVTPEYNHSFPGSLKRMLDSEFGNYMHKPVALAGASDGNWGGVRAVEALIPAVKAMGLVVTFTSIYFPYVDKLFGSNGQPTEERTEASVRKAFEELVWMAKTLKWGREKLK